MPSVIKYSLFVLADLAILGFIVHYTLSMLRGQTSLMERLDRMRHPGTFDKLKVGSYYVAVLLSFGLALYGALVFLFSWMPYEWLHYDQDGDEYWMASWLAGMGAFFGTGFLLYGLEKTNAKILKLGDLQLGEAKERAFVKLIKNELDQIRWILSHSQLKDVISTVRNLVAIFGSDETKTQTNCQIDDLSGPQTEVAKMATQLDQAVQKNEIKRAKALVEKIAELNEKIGPNLAKLEREIDNADIYPQLAEVCRDLLNVIRMTFGVPLPAKPSPASEALPEGILDVTRHS
jgi:hypothetical protein